MTDRSHFDRLLPQLKDGSLPVGVMLDWLDEFGGYPEWCVAWRDCPETAEEFQARWAGWLKQVEPGRLVQKSKSGWVSVDRRRWEAVRDAREDVHRFVGLLTTDPGVITVVASTVSPAMADMVRYGHTMIPPPALEHPAVKAAEARARATVRLDRKRRVLGLFPEVVCEERQLRFSTDLIGSQDDLSYRLRWAEEKIRANDWPAHVRMDVRHDEKRRQIVYRQTVHAPDLIPPEPPEYGPSPLSGAYRIFDDDRLIRQFQEMRRRREAERLEDALRGVADDLWEQNFPDTPRPTIRLDP